MRCQKGPQIALGDPHDMTNTMHDKITGADPPPYRTSADSEALGDLRDREEFALVTPASAALSAAGSCICIAGAEYHYDRPSLMHP
jgi:hypothetical protein